MSDKIKLKIFTDGEISALAYLYVQSQDLSEKTPTEIHDMYWKAYYEILRDYRQRSNLNWFSQMREEALKD